jgi:hypothetical protein
MRGVSLFLLAALSAAPAAANSADCGANAFTYAEVVEARPGASSKGPVTSIPDSLCADHVEDRRTSIGSFSLQIGDPHGTPAARGRGMGARAPAR